MSLILLPASEVRFAWMLGEAPALDSLSLPPGGIEEAWVLRWLRDNLALLRGTVREGTGSWLMAAGGEVVGLCSYKGPPEDGVVEIGYAVAPQRRRRGYATAAVTALIGLAEQDAHISDLSAETALANLASQRVLEANGFAATGRGFDRDEGEMILWRRALGPGGGGDLRRVQ